MAEPVGITGTAVGLASFGLQLYGAVSAYLDALETRSEDLKSARAQLEALGSSLTNIESALPRLGSSVRGNVDTTTAIMASCRTELNQLEELLQRLVDSPTPISRMKERMKKLAFPFHRKALIELEEKLERTNGALSTVLGALQLRVLPLLCSLILES
jgi:chromosome segregation ATPase